MNSSVKLTQRQIEDAEAAQSAQLTFDDVQGTIEPYPIFSADLTITVTNNGQTTANEVCFWSGNSMHNNEAEPNPVPGKGNLTPTHNLTCPSIGAGKNRA